jgi:hypothetical protein
MTETCIDGEGGIWRETDGRRELIGHDMGEGLMTEDTQKYLVWSNEHQAWWAPNKRGYISVISKAGRYHRTAAEQICRHANAFIDKDAEPHEVMVLAPECLEPPVRPVAHGEGRAPKL